MFIYPENLKAKATLFLWGLRDLAVIGTALLLAILCLVVFKTFVPFAFAVAYAFLAVRIEGFCVLDFLRFGTTYFIITPQYYEWSLE